MEGTPVPDVLRLFLSDGWGGGFVSPPRNSNQHEGGAEYGRRVETAYICDRNSFLGVRYPCALSLFKKFQDFFHIFQIKIIFF